MLFLASLLGQWISGWMFENQELARHGEQTISLTAFLGDPEFLSTVFEKLSPLQLAEWVIADKLPVRFQLQMHKYIWDPNERGV